LDCLFLRLGAEGLRAELRGHEGRGPATRLTPVLFEAAGVASPDELLTWTREGEKARVAALSPRIAQVAEEGDPVAARLVEAAVQALLDHLRALRPLFGPDDPTVALVGGLVQPGGPLREHLVGRLGEVGCRLHPEAVDGAQGAARMVLSI
jgi:glucosamine kinase